MAKNVAVGLLRPPHVFFYEVDVKKGKFRATKKRLLKYANKLFEYFSVYRTKHGYHLHAFGHRRYGFFLFQKLFPSDFTRSLRSRWGVKDPKVLRISEKWDLKTGKVVSPKPKFICGNFFLEGIINYKVLYYAK